MPVLILADIILGDEVFWKLLILTDNAQFMDTHGIILKVRAARTGIHVWEFGKKEAVQVRIDAGMERAAAREVTARERGRHFTQVGYSLQESFGNTVWLQKGSRVQALSAAGGAGVEQEGEEPCEEAVSNSRESEAEKIYQAAVSGKRNPIEDKRRAPKVPYEHLAKDGVITYNGVCFVCDEKTNSICLGDMTDEKNVLNIPLSGGGHLKVNRNSLGLLSRAAGMFTPEDLNLIMRAIAQDTKIQSVQEEIKDAEASLGANMKSTGAAEDSRTKA